MPEKINNFSLFKLTSKKPQVPDLSEVSENIPSRSAKLRYAIRNNNSFLYPNDFKKKFINYFKLEEGRI